MSKNNRGVGRVKKFFFFFLIFIFVPFILLSEIIIPEDTPPSVRNALIKNLEGRTENAELKECVINDDIVTLTLLLENKELKTTFPLKGIEKEIKNMLFYEKSLYRESPVLEYVYSSSYSAKLGESYRRGTMLECRDLNNTLRGLFKVSGNYDEESEFRGEFLRNPLPGMKIKKAPSLSWDLSYYTQFNNTHSLSLSLYDSSLIYPFYPIIGVDGKFNKTNSSIFFSIGIGSKFSFASFFSNIPFIKDLSINASALLHLGYTTKVGFDFSSSYSINLLYSPSSYFYLYLGIKGDGNGIYMNTGIGGRF